MKKIDARERLIVALDTATASEARQMAERLGDAVRFYKVGLVLQLAPGTEDLIQWLLAQGKKVFLDYKYYDIPETMRKAVASACRLGVSFLTIHGSSSQVRAAVAGRGASELKIFTVTVLTSMNEEDLAELGASVSVAELAKKRALTALEAGSDGVIASGHEARAIKELSGGKLLVITPGIRESSAPADDQKRAMTARQAVLEGADYLVVGRPITGHADPRAEAARIVQNMQAAFDERSTGAIATEV